MSQYGIRGVGFWFFQIVLGILACALAGDAMATTVTWSGAGGVSWGTGLNWSNTSGPGIGDSAAFNDTGASVLPGDVTSVLDVSRSIAGLSFNDTAGKFHTLDLNASTLTVTGNITFNLDQSALSTTSIRNGTLNVNSPFTTFNVGRAASGSSKSIVDLSGLTALTGTMQDLYVGSSTASTAAGTLTLSHANNNLTLQHIYVGTANSSNDANGTLHLGLANTFAASEVDIGKDNGSGTVDIVPGGTLTLGTAGARTLLQLGVEALNSNTGYTGKVDLAAGTLNAYLSSVTVGQKQGGADGTAAGVLNAGSGGVIDIGAPGNTADFYVGRQLTGGGKSSGTVDFSGATTLTASLNTFAIGTALSGSAFGSVKLAKSNTIDALSIVVGQGGGDTSILHLGKNTTLHTNSLTISQENASATVSISAGGSLALGSPAQRTDVLIASSAANTNGNMTGKLDLTGATFTAYLGNLTVGQRDGVGGGASVGSIIGANGGSIDIGSPAPGNTANLYVARQLTGGSTAIGNVDFGGLATLTASLNNLTVGTAQTGNATGTLIFAQSNDINAKTIIVGSGGDGNNLLALGKTNTIRANQLIIAQNYAHGVVTIPAGGTLNLGSPSQRTTLLMATGITNTNTTYSATFDLGNATLTAYLANVTIGNKDTQSGAEQGTLTIGTSAANYVEAGNILLGGTRSTGTLNFGGGVLIANSIARGEGTGNFNWTGGRLSIGSFGTNTTSFNLANSSSGTLAPGSAAQAIGTTTVYGNYSQGIAATTAMDLSSTGNDLLAISGSANLNGTLSLGSLDNFVPSVGQSFLLATYGSRTGTFSFVAPPKLAPEAAFQLDYSNPTQLLLRIVTPTAASYVAPAPTGVWATAASWSTNAVPATITATNLVNNGAAPKIVTVAANTTVHRVNLEGASPSAPMTLEILQGIRFGVANQLIVGPNASLAGGGTIVGDVISGAGASIAPGPAAPAAASPGILHVNGSLNTQAASNLLVEIGGTVAGVNYDQLNVSGIATLSGSIAVKLINGFNPVALQKFDVLTYASHTGAFTAAGPISAGGQLVFAPVYSGDRLSLIATLPGDATADGNVSFDDLVVLAQDYGSTHATWSQGDFNNDGIVSFEDLVTVAQHYGQGTGLALEVPGASAEFNSAWAEAVASVPEPASLAVALLILPALSLRCRRAIAK